MKLIKYLACVSAFVEVSNRMTGRTRGIGHLLGEKQHLGVARLGGSPSGNTPPVGNEVRGNT